MKKLLKFFLVFVIMFSLLQVPKATVKADFCDDIPIEQKKYWGCP